MGPRIRALIIFITYDKIYIIKWLSRVDINRNSFKRDRGLQTRLEGLRVIWINRKDGAKDHKKRRDVSGELNLTILYNINISLLGAMRGRYLCAITFRN